MHESRFESMAVTYRKDIDREVGAVAAEFQGQTIQDYGEYASLPVEALCSLYTRDGKRIRGMLTVCGYEMLGGRDHEMIIRAASAVELLHTYILGIDDIQDRSDTRRGGDSTHKMLENESISRGWRGDHSHTGMSLGLDGSLTGSWYALNLLKKLNIPDNVYRCVSGRIFETMIITAHGQTGDIINEVNGEVTEEDIENVILRKTAYYTVLNPLQVGMELAGATEERLQLVSSFATPLGMIYQFTDDALTYVADHHDKDPAVDIKDGKMTLIMFHALRVAEEPDREFLRSSLGNQNLTQHDFKRVVEIVKSTGAVDLALERAGRLANEAVQATDDFPMHWRRDNVEFLRYLPRKILERTR